MNPFVHVLGWTLVHALWQGFLLVLLAALGGLALHFLLDRYQGDVQKAVAAYNCGVKALDEGRISAEATRYRALVLDVLAAKAVQPETSLGEGEIQGVLCGAWAAAS